MMAGLAGIAQGLFSSLGSEMGSEFTILGLLVAVVGGVRSINGALLAGVLLGIVNAYASRYIGAYVAFIILLSAASVSSDMISPSSCRCRPMWIVLTRLPHTL